MPVSDFTPSVEDIGQLLRARTTARGSGGTELGTFDERTTPTGEQVDGLIAKSVSQLAARIGADLAPERVGAAAFLAELFAAMLVETTYFPEQVRQGQSAYPQLKDLYDDGLKALLEALGADAPEATRRRRRHGALRITTPLTPPDPPVV